MSNGSPILSRLALALAAFVLLACGAVRPPTAPDDGAPRVAAPSFDGTPDAPPPPAEPDTSAGTDGNYQSPHV